MTMLLKKILLITYHFPPSAASGTFRLLGFARHLPTFGWQPLVVASAAVVCRWEPDRSAAGQRDVPDGGGCAGMLPLSRSGHRSCWGWCTSWAQNAIWLPRGLRFACKRLIQEHRPDVILTSGLAALRTCPGALFEAFERIAVGRGFPRSVDQRWRKQEARLDATLGVVLGSARCSRTQNLIPGERARTRAVRLRRSIRSRVEKIVVR